MRIVFAPRQAGHRIDQTLEQRNGQGVRVHEHGCGNSEVPLRATKPEDDTQRERDGCRHDGQRDEEKRDDP